MVGLSVGEEIPEGEIYEFHYRVSSCFGLRYLFVDRCPVDGGIL